MSKEGNMNRIPSELWTEIFSNACTDNGFTGRSLSLVSRYIHECSKSVKIQSISIIGLPQMIRFVTFLENAPHPQHVRQLFIAAGDPQKSPLENSNLQENDLSDVYSRLLQAVAPTVRHIGTYLPFPRKHILLPVALPGLVGLTLYGPLHHQLAPEEPQAPFPSLRHLHLALFYFYPSDLFGCIAKLAPHITHLRISGPQQDPPLHRDLQLALGMRQPTLERDRLVGSLPSSVQKVLVQSGPGLRGCSPSPDSIYCACGPDNYERGPGWDDRFVVLKSRKDGRRASTHEAEREWLERNDGGEVNVLTRL